MASQPRPVILEFQVKNTGERALQNLESGLAKVEKNLDASARASARSDQAFAKSASALSTLAGGANVADAAFGRLALRFNSTDLAVGGTVASLAAVGVVLTSGAREAREFSRAFSGVRTLIDETTTNAKELEDSIHGLSVEFGQSSITQATALFDLLQSGIEDAAEATELLRVANIGAQAGLTDTATIVGGLLAAMKPYNLEVSEAARVSDKLFAAVEVGILSMGQLAGVLGDVTPIAAAAGVSLDDILGSIAGITAATKVGASEAATQVSSLLRAVITGGERSAAVMRQLGVEIKGFNIENLQALGLVEFIKQLGDQLEGLGTNDRLAVLSELTGRVEAARAVLTLMGPAGKIAENAIDKVAKASGNAQRAADIVGESFDSVAGSIEQAFKRVELELGQAFGEFVVDAGPALIAGLEATAEAVDALTALVPVLEASMVALGAGATVAYVGFILADDALTSFSLGTKAATAVARIYAESVGLAGVSLIQAGKPATTFGEILLLTNRISSDSVSTFTEASDALTKYAARLHASAAAQRASQEAALFELSVTERLLKSRRLATDGLEESIGAAIRSAAATTDAARELKAAVLANLEATSTSGDTLAASFKQLAAEADDAILKSAGLAGNLSKGAAEAERAAATYLRLGETVRVAATTFSGLVFAADLFSILAPIFAFGANKMAESTEAAAQRAADLAAESAKTRLVLATLSGDVDNVREALTAAASAQDLAFRSEDVARFRSSVLELIPGLSTLVEFFAAGAFGLGSNELSEPFIQLEAQAKLSLAAVRALRDETDSLAKSQIALTGALGSLGDTPADAFLGLRDSLADFNALSKETADALAAGFDAPAESLQRLDRELEAVQKGIDLARSAAEGAERDVEAAAARGAAIQKRADAALNAVIFDSSSSPQARALAEQRFLQLSALADTEKAASLTAAATAKTLRAYADQAAAAVTSYDAVGAAARNAARAAEEAAEARAGILAAARLDEDQRTSETIVSLELLKIDNARRLAAEEGLSRSRLAVELLKEELSEESKILERKLATAQAAFAAAESLKDQLNAAEAVARAEQDIEQFAIERLTREQAITEELHRQEEARARAEGQFRNDASFDLREASRRALLEEIDLREKLGKLTDEQAFDAKENINLASLEDQLQTAQKAVALAEEDSLDRLRSLEKVKQLEEEIARVRGSVGLREEEMFKAREDAAEKHLKTEKKITGELEKQTRELERQVEKAKDLANRASKDTRDQALEGVFNNDVFASVGFGDSANAIQDFTNFGFEAGDQLKEFEAITADLEAASAERNSALLASQAELAEATAAGETARAAELQGIVKKNQDALSEIEGAGVKLRTELLLQGTLYALNAVDALLLDAARADEEHRKELLAAHKAIAIVEAIISTAVGVTKALELGPILGPTLATIIAAVGAAQVGIIASQPTAFEQGGVVQPGQRAGVRSDEVDAVLHAGEVVLTRGDVAAAKSAANSSQGLGASALGGGDASGGGGAALQTVSVMSEEELVRALNSGKVRKFLSTKVRELNGQNGR